MKFSHSRTEERLHTQYVKHGAILPSARPQERSLAPTGVENRRRLHTLNILLGLSIFILCAGLVLLLVT